MECLKCGCRKHKIGLRNCKYIRPWIKLPWYLELIYSPILIISILWIIYWFIVPVNYLIIPYCISLGSIWFTNIIILIEYILAIINTFKKDKLKLNNKGKKVESEEDNKITIVIPVYLPNELEIIEETIKYILNLEDLKYNNVDLIVILNGGKKNNTWVKEEYNEILKRLEKLNIVFFYVEKSRSKAENMNYAIDIIHTKYIYILDADHRPKECAITRALGIMYNNPEINCIQGMCMIDINRKNKFLYRLLARIISVEFAELYGVNHYGGQVLHGYGIFGGSNAIWKTETLKELYFSSKMLTEDIDISYRCLLK